MISAICDHCKKKINVIVRDINIFQPLDNDGKKYGDLCKQCYKEYCDWLDTIDRDYQDKQDIEEDNYRKSFFEVKQ